MSEKTTITISKELKYRLEQRKEHPRSTYEEVIISLMKKAENHKLISPNKHSAQSEDP